MNDYIYMILFVIGVAKFVSLERSMLVTSVVMSSCMLVFVNLNAIFGLTGDSLQQGQYLLGGAVALSAYNLYRIYLRSREMVSRSDPDDFL